METPVLRYVVAVAQAGSVTRAALELGIAQPALSQAITRLEKQLGVRLFERDRRGARLTAAGQVLVEESGQALRLIDQAEQRVRDMAAGTAGRLTVGLVSSSLVSLLPRALRAMREAAPQVQIVLREMSNAEQAEALAQGRIDVGLMHTPVRVQGRMREKRLVRDRLIAAVPAAQPLDARGRIDLDAIARAGLVMFPDSQLPVFNAQIAEVFQRRGLPLSVVQEANRTLTVLACVAAGMGVALLPTWIRTLAFEGVHYCEIAGGGELPPFDLSAVWPARSVQALADRFVQILEQTRD